MRKVVLFVKYYIQLRYDAFRLWIAVKIADAKQKAYNKRYFVLSDVKGRLQVLNSQELKSLRKPQKIKKNVNGKIVTRKVYLMNPKATYLDWMRESIYYTPVSLNNERISKEEREKRKQSWLLQMEKLRFSYNMKRKKYAEKERKNK